MCSWMLLVFQAQKWHYNLFIFSNWIVYLYVSLIRRHRNWSICRLSGIYYYGVQHISVPFAWHAFASSLQLLANIFNVVIDPEDLSWPDYPSVCFIFHDLVHKIHRFIHHSFGSRQPEMSTSIETWLTFIMPNLVHFVRSEVVNLIIIFRL